MASILRVNTLTDASSNNSTAMSVINQGVVKVFVSYKSSSSHSIFNSTNTASLTDNGTGDTTINFTSNFSSVNELCCTDVHGTVSSGFPAAAYHDGCTFVHAASYATSSVRQGTGYSSTSAAYNDDDRVGLMILGDLA